MIFITRPDRLLLVAIVLLLFSRVLAQEALPGRIEITQQDSSEFPAISLNVILTDNQSQPITNTTTLKVTENGLAVSELQIEPVPAGLDLVFVIDANTYISQIDDDSGQTRLEKIKVALTDFATLTMDRTELDQVTIVVPDESDPESGRFIGESLSQSSQVVAAIAGYAPETFADTPLQVMMAMALGKLAESQAEGRFQAVVLFTDGGTIDQQLDEQLLLTDPGRAAIFGLILGSRADSNEIVNVTRLSTPTNGYYWHMPNPEDAAPLFERLQANRSQYHLQYHSNAGEAGRYTIQVMAGDLSDSSTFDLQLGPPEIHIELAATTIQRVGDQPDTPLADLEPTVQPITVQLNWGDNLPLDLLAAVLLVNGQSQGGVSAPVLSETGQLRLNWDISDLDAGEYELAIRVTDALGLQQESEPLMVTIELVRPELPTATPVPEPTPTPTPAIAIPKNLTNPRLLLVIGAAGLILLLLGLWLRRRRRQRMAMGDERQELNERLQGLWDADLDSHPAGMDNPLLTKAEATAHATQPAGAYLDILQNAPEYTAPIPLTGDNITIGHDPQLAQIAFSDKSVSRLHARIRRRGSDYWLYDEGSATGTFLNFERIGLAPRLLENGNELHIGRVHIRFRVSQS